MDHITKSDMIASAARQMLSPVRGGSNSCITSPSDSSNEAAAQNGPSGNAGVACCSISVQTEPDQGPSSASLIFTPSISLQQGTSAVSASSILLENLQRRIAELELENNAQRQALAIAKEHNLKSRQIIQDLLIEKVLY